nr:PREDICTED: ras-related protein Ral-A-like [Lepisosteus oculatus]
MESGRTPGGAAGGPSREYKLVMLGEGGVGKSGEYWECFLSVSVRSALALSPHSGGQLLELRRCCGAGTITCLLCPPALQVSVEEGRGLAREFQCPFFETSAAFRYYIDEVFAALVRQIRQREKEAVSAVERKSRRHGSVWTRIRSPFRRKKHPQH